jgi:hypothetical protein
MFGLWGSGFDTGEYREWVSTSRCLHMIVSDSVMFCGKMSYGEVVRV